MAPAATDNRGNLRRGREAKKSSTVAQAPQGPCVQTGRAAASTTSPGRGSLGWGLCAPRMGKSRVSPPSHHQPVLNGATTTARPSAESSQPAAAQSLSSIAKPQQAATRRKSDFQQQSDRTTETSAWLLSGVGAQQRRKQLTLLIQLSALSEKPSHILPSRRTRKIPPLEPLLPQTNAEERHSHTHKAPPDTAVSSQPMEMKFNRNSACTSRPDEPHRELSRAGTSLVSCRAGEVKHLGLRGCREPKPTQLGPQTPAVARAGLSFT